MTFCNIDYDGNNECEQLLRAHVTFESLDNDCSYCGIVIPAEESQLMVVWESTTDAGTAIQYFCSWCEDWFNDSEIDMIFTDHVDFANRLIDELEQADIDSFEESYQNFMSKSEPLRQQFAERFPEVMVRIDEIRQELDDMDFED